MPCQAQALDALEDLTVTPFLTDAPWQKLTADQATRPAKPLER
jgi:hypothetical protein